MNKLPGALDVGVEVALLTYPKVEPKFSKLLLDLADLELVRVFRRQLSFDCEAKLINERIPTRREVA